VSQTDDRRSARSARRAARRQAVSIGLAVARSAWRSVWRALCRPVTGRPGSSLVFTGASQFAAVSVLSARAAAAIAAGVLLAALAAYGLLAPSLEVRSAAGARLATRIDEARRSARPATTSPCAGTATSGVLRGVRHGTLTVAGAARADGGGLIRRLGIDATIPAAFLALIPPSGRPVQRCRAGGAAIAVVLIPRRRPASRSWRPPWESVRRTGEPAPATQR
jgi:hypothetical protein